MKVEVHKLDINKLVNAATRLNNLKITSNKTKYLQVEKKLNSLWKKDYVSLSKNYFTSNDGSQK